MTVLLIIFLGSFYYYNLQKQNFIQEETTLLQTVDISKKYIVLRLETDNVLTNAKNYENYESWNTEMTKIINDWSKLEQQSQALNAMASETAKKVAFNFTLIKTAHAYSAKEITDIYDKAPKLKGIATLANHLGVDAKRAQAILNQAQAEISSEIFTEEGKAFENLENTAIVVKDGCKVAGFVGGVVLTGGTAGFAAASTLTQVSVVVAGADLALEITEDGAQIALGDKNKVTSLVKDVRTVTEPIASVLSITNIPENLGSAYGKIDAVMIGLEKFRQTAQEGKVIGIDLTNFESHRPFQVIRKTQYPKTLSVAEMEKTEVEEWLKSLNKQQTQMSNTEVLDYLSNEVVQIQQIEKPVDNKEIKEENFNSSEVNQNETNQNDNTTTPNIDNQSNMASNSNTTQNMIGTYNGTAVLQHIEEDIEAPDSLPVTLQLNEGGKGVANVNGFTGDVEYAGNSVTFSVTMKDSGATIYCTFKGRAVTNDDSITISGTMNFTMMGVNFASYTLNAQK